MGDIDKEDDSLASELYRNTMTGQWKKVVEMYEEHHIKAISAKINTSGDTALHVAVSFAPDKKVLQLVCLIKDWYDKAFEKKNKKAQYYKYWYEKDVEKNEDWSNENIKNPKIELDKVEKEITDIWESAIWIKNNEGNTPLHVAASAPRLRICILLIGSFNSIQPLGMHNNLGECPLFLAALHGHKDIFLCLHGLFLQGKSKFSTTDLEIDPAYLRSTDDETILHCAIKWEYFDLAFEILDLEPRLACFVNKKRITPLHLLANKPVVFKSSFHLGWWKKIIYRCIYVEELKRQIALPKLMDSVIEEINDSSETEDENNQNFPESYHTCICFYRKLKAKAQVVIETIKEHCKGQNEDVENPSKSNSTGQPENKGIYVEELEHEKESIDSAFEPSKNSPITEDENNQNFPKCYQTCICFYQKLKAKAQVGSQVWSKAQQLQSFIGRYANNIFHLCHKILSWVILRLGYEDLKKIKEKHVHSVQIMKLLIKLELAKDLKLDFSSGVCPKQKTEAPVLLAARNGITEMVEQILAEFPLAINDQSEGKNIVLWAVKNRQPRVLQLLLKQDFVKRKLIQEVDTEKNNALHLAAEIGKKKPWLIPGAAIQMQWEIKWYEFVKDNLPQHYCYQHNKKGETPEEIFNKTHKVLVREGGEWLKSTSNSCSVVATLIATVVFPAATTVPGGINDSSGMPILVEHPAFTLFAISSLVALCFSIIALFLFLTILTSQYQQTDFRSHVPRKLLLGLTLLFVSIGSMLISFCAGQFFLLKRELKDMAFPVYTMICLPIILLSIAQFPLYFQLLKVTFKKVPPPSY